jgi:hypothetical protein
VMIRDTKVKKFCSLPPWGYKWIFCAHNHAAWWMCTAIDRAIHAPDTQCHHRPIALHEPDRVVQFGEKIRVDRPRLQQQHKQYKHDQSCSLMNKSGLRQIGLADNNRTSSDHKSRPVYQKPASLGQYNTSDELEATTAIWPHEINSRRHALSLPQGLPLVYNDIDPARIEDV